MQYAIDIYDRGEVAASYEDTKPPVFQVGDRLQAGMTDGIIARVEHELKETTHHVRVHLSSEPAARTPPGAPMTDFLRYHVLVRVFDGRAEDWLLLLDETSRGDTEDARFLRWLGARLSSDPQLLDDIRHTVDSSGLWPV